VVGSPVTREAFARPSRPARTTAKLAAGRCERALAKATIFPLWMR